MKKMIHLFNKKKRLTIVSGDIAPDAVPEEPRDIPRYISKPSELYRRHKFDNCCNQEESQEINHIFNSNEFKVTEETLRINSSEGGTGNLYSAQSPSDRIEDITKSFERNLPNISQTLPAVSSIIEPITEKESHNLNLNKSDSLSLKDVDNSRSRIGSSSDLALPDINTAQGISSDLFAKKIEDKKNIGSTYVITITNSAHFHIGSQKTVNYPGAEDNVAKRKELQLTHIKNGQILPLNSSQIVDIKETLSEEDLCQIALSIRDKWRDFAKNLDVDDSTIQELEDLNGQDYNVIVYEILQQYLSRYPSTSVGFMINVLNKSNEVEAIRKLLEKR